jgi:hypothetical protein
VFNKDLLTVDSLWQVPLPLSEYTTSRVVVYFYAGSWIPIAFYPLAEAIKLHRKGLSSGMDIAVFPPDLDPGSSKPKILDNNLTPEKIA